MSAHLVLILLVWIVIIAGVVVDARSRGRSWPLWGTVVFFTGFVGLFVYAVVLLTESEDEPAQVRVCPSCSARHTGDPDYCSECGEPLGAETEATTASIIMSGSRSYCGNCHSRVERDADSCESCGAVF